MTIATLRLPWADFESLVTGTASPSTINLLRDGQLNKNLLLLRAILDDARQHHPAAFSAARVEAHYDLLADIQLHDADAVLTVLAHPQVGAFLSQCLRRLLADTEPGSVLEQLGAVAASAAIHAGYECEVAAPIEQRTVFLPTLGLAHLDHTPTADTATVRCGPDGVIVHGVSTEITLPANPREDAPGWTGMRRLHATCDGQQLTVDLDDLSPYREFGEPATGRLPDDTIARWRRLLADAWALLVREHPHHAALTAATLTSIGTLKKSKSSSASVTSPDAFGAVFMSPPADAVTLAETLVHELSHSILSALLELVPLYTSRQGELFYSPWREDPRPLGGILHGAHSFLAVADFRRTQRNLVGDQDAHFAHFEFIRCREEVDRALETLLTSDRLTDHGVQFVRGMAARLASWENLDVPVPPTPAELAHQELTDHRLRWRLCNVRPDQQQIHTIATAWLAGDPNPVRYDDVATEVLPGARKRLEGQRGRVRLTHLRLKDPGRFGRVVAGEAALPVEARDADLAFIAGDHAEAVRKYRRQIADQPERIEQWAGMALACRRPGDPVGRMLTTRPEVACAVYRQVRAADPEADPLDLAHWLIEEDNHARRGR